LRPAFSCLLELSSIANTCALLCDRAKDINMQYDKILGLALIPTIVFFLLSLVSLALTTHYWILGDWTIPRGVSVVTGFNEQIQTSTIDYTIVYFKDNETDATIAAGCLCLSAAVMALIAWSTLRKPGMDTQFAAVCHGISPVQSYTNGCCRANVDSGFLRSL
jgi:hypothetical protein